MSILGLCLLLTPHTVLATVNNDTHWLFEVAENRNAIYGTVSGIYHLQLGDSVGVFDIEGNCYGAGLFNGLYYFLPAFEADEGNKTGDDFPIPGFNPGDEVVFRVYSEAEGKEYVVKPSFGASYIYTSHGMYPPLKIDLVYEKGDDGGDGGDGTGDEFTPTIPGKLGLPTLKETDSGSDESAGAISETDGIVLKTEEDSMVTYYGSEDEGYSSIDYPKGERAYREGKPPKGAIRDSSIRRPAKSKTAPSSYVKPKAVEKELAKTKPEAPVKKRIPLTVKIFLVLGIPALIIVAAKKFLII